MRMLWSAKFLFPTLTIAAFYVALTVYLMNAVLLNDAIFGGHSWRYAWSLTLALVTGIGTTMSQLSLILLVTVALLTGVNMTLLARNVCSRRAAGKLHLVVGGSSLLGLAGGGCASCALPLLALLGFSGALAYLPFRGLELSLLAISLLIVSLVSLIKSSSTQQACLVPQKAKSR